MKLTEIEKEDLELTVTSLGFPLVLRLIDERIDVIRGNVLSVSLDKDPAKAQLQLYTERMKLEGAVALRTALLEQLKAIKEKR